MNNVEQAIVVYGTSFCPKCKQLVTLLDKESVAHKYVNVEPGDLEFKMLLNADVKSFPALKINGNFVHKSSIPDMWKEIEVNLK